MATPFWGLYDGLSPKGPTVDTTKTNVESAENQKKRKNDEAGLKPRSTQRAVMAPRAARMVKRGIKETTSTTTQKKRVNLIHCQLNCQ